MTSKISKLIIRIPRFSRPVGRIKTVGGAVIRIAEMLGSDIEVTQMNGVSVWVCYRNGGKEDYPLYMDCSNDWSEDEVFSSMVRELEAMSVLPEKPVLQVA